MKILDLSDTIAAIHVHLRRSQIAELRRAYVRQGEELVPTGQVQWFIQDRDALKRLVVLSCADKDRSISLGTAVAAAPEHLKVHRLLELMTPSELEAICGLLNSDLACDTRSRLSADSGAPLDYA